MEISPEGPKVFFSVNNTNSGVTDVKEVASKSSLYNY